MNKKHVLKASFTEYIHYYKRLKLGLQKACFFLRDLEFELEKYAQKNVTEHRYYNPDTKKELFFLTKDVLEIRKKLESLVLEYFILKPELLKSEEYDSFENFIVKSMFCFDISEYDNLDFITSFRSDLEDKKLDILARIFLLIEQYLTTDFEQALKIFGYYIIDFCIIRCKLSKEQEMKICDRLNVSSLDQLASKEILHKEIARPLLEHLLLMDPKKYFIKNNKLEKNFPKLDLEVPDYSMNIKLPKVFSLEKKNSYCVDLEKFFFFLQDLDDYRIRFDLKRINSRVYNIEYLHKFEQMCLRFNSPDTYQVLRGYFCNFLKKDLLNVQELKLNDRFSLYFWEILDFIKKIHLARLNLHNKLFSYYVISCFSSYEYHEQDIFFSITKAKFFKKKKMVESKNVV